MAETRRIPLWTRVVTNEEFRVALIADPLRAVADAGDVAVSAEQLRILEDMDPEEREELVADVVRDVYMKGAVARFGDLGLDGRLGGPDPPHADGPRAEDRD